MSILLETDGPCYDPDLYASLGDDARKAERENAVTEAHEGGGGDDGTNDAYFAAATPAPEERPCICTLYCIGQLWLNIEGGDYFCRESRSAEGG